MNVYRLTLATPGGSGESVRYVAATDMAAALQGAGAVVSIALLGPIVLPDPRSPRDDR
jgi:hypothetical protein